MADEVREKLEEHYSKDYGSSEEDSRILGLSERLINRIKVLNAFAIIGLCVLVITLTASTSFILGSSQFEFSFRTGILNMEEVQAEGEIYRIENYTISILPEGHRAWENNSLIGFTFMYEDEKIFIKDGLTPKQTYSTCVHEKLHNVGMDGGETYEHELIYDYDNQIVDDTCIKLMHSLNAVEVGEK